MINESFLEDFKNLWNDEPGKKISLNNLEELYSGLIEMVQIFSSKQSQLRDISEINKDFQKLVKEKRNNDLYDELVPEMINFFFNRITIRAQLKVIESLQLLFYSCNTANSYGCVLATRSILENVAAYQYLISSIPWKKNPYVKKDVAKQFLNTLYLLGFGSRFNWDLLHSDPKKIKDSFGTGTYPWNRPKNRRIPEISVFCKNLDHVLAEDNRIKAGQITFIYTILSDIIHPSAGGDFIYASDMFKKLEVNQKKGENFKRLFNITGFYNVEFARQFILLCHEIPNYEIKNTILPS